MPRKLIVANWKMHKTVKEALDYVIQFLPLVKDLKDREIGIAPPFTALESVKRALSETSIKLCAQNAFYETKGAYTGEVSPHMLKDIGVDYVILGHSERRQYFHETDQVINRKVHCCLKEGLRVIFCIGETFEQRKSNKTIEVLKEQILKGLQEVNDSLSLAIAYEPVWAIGTGVVATEEQIREAHLFIREQLRELFSESAEHIPILYGGSVTEDNIASIMKVSNVDGVLVGGASLDPVKFAKIVNYDK